MKRRLFYICVKCHSVPVFIGGHFTGRGRERLGDEGTWVENIVWVKEFGCLLSHYCQN